MGIALDFLRIWRLGLFQPLKAFNELKNKQAPLWGLKAVLIRFVGGSILGAILLFLLPNQIPFEKPYINLISEDVYYIAQVFFCLCLVL